MTSSSELPSYQLFVGVDIAAKTVAAAWMTLTGRPSHALTIEQTPQGYAELQQA